MELISKEALIKRLKEWNTNDSMDKALYNFALNRVIEQPTVEAVPGVHGEWIKINNRPKTYIRRCSVCGRDSYTCFSEKDYDYCPWCRADMRKKV